MQNAALHASKTPELLVGRTKRKVFFTMMHHPAKGWIRVGRPFASREVAKSWVPFVEKAKGGAPVHVESFTLIFDNGSLTPACVKRLSARYNMDPPAPEAKGPASGAQSA